MYQDFIICSSVDGHLGCFHVLTILVSSGYMLRSGIAGSYGGFIPSFLRNLQHNVLVFMSQQSYCLSSIILKIKNNKEEDIGSTLFDIHHSKILFDPPPRVMEIKTKINKWDLIKFKSFYTAKEIKNKMKKQPSEWEKIIANETDKGLISRIYKQLIQLNMRKTYNPIKKWAEDPNISQRRHTDGQ